MGYDLFSPKKGQWRFNVHSWPKAMELAKLYGWKPMGTKKNYEMCRDVAKSSGIPLSEIMDYYYSDFEGEYLRNSYQIVTTKDARNLAAALRKALDDIPDVLDIDKEYTLTPEEVTAWLNRQGYDVTLTYAETGEQQKVSVGDLPQDIVHHARMPEAMVTPLNPHLDPLQFFGGPQKPWLEKFIEFCEGGKFFIG